MTAPTTWPNTFEFACLSAACRPPGKNGGTGGSSKGGTKPGGAIGMRVVHHKSIPNVSDERLIDSLDQIHKSTHTREGIYGHTGSRRQLIEQGVKGKQISQELIKRGHPKPTCKFCAPNEFPTDPAPVLTGKQKGTKPGH